MTPNQLRAFLEVVGTGSVRQAAQRLFVSSPAVSATLAALQKELGVALVEREGRGLIVTPAGLVFARYARSVLGLLEEAAVAVAAEDDPERGRVRLAAVTTAGEHVLPPFLASFRRDHADAGISLEVANRARVWDLLDNHEVDLVIGGRPPESARFRTLATRANELIVVAAPGGTPLVRRGRRGGGRTVAAELEAQVWLLREHGSGTRSTALELFAHLGIAPSVLTLGSNGAIRESVQVGLGITLISRDAVARELERDELEEWHVPSWQSARAWHLVGRLDGGLPATAALFRDHVTTAAGGDVRPFAIVR